MLKDTGFAHAHGNFPRLDSKDAAHDALEDAREDYVHRAREAAFDIYRKQGFVTVDDVRKVCPPPKGKDTRVMGAIFRRQQGWMPTGTIPSKRKECHGRPIQRFVFMKEEQRGKLDFS